MSTTKTHYEALGLPQKASGAEIKAAYRRLAFYWHPDRRSGAEAEVRMREINGAYDVLRDEKKKLVYDAELVRRREGGLRAKRARPAAASPWPAAEQPPRQQYEPTPRSDPATREHGRREAQAAAGGFDEHLRAQQRKARGGLF